MNVEMYPNPSKNRYTLLDDQSHSPHKTSYRIRENAAFSGRGIASLSSCDSESSGCRNLASSYEYILS